MDTQHAASTAPAKPPPGSATPAIDLAKRALYIKIEFHLFGNSKKIPPSQVALRDGQTGSGEIDENVKQTRYRAAVAGLAEPSRRPRRGGLAIYITLVSACAQADAAERNRR